jgi:Ca2+-transporting ATPase
MPSAPHNLDPASVMHEFDVTKNGLSDHQAESRLVKYGPNTLRHTEKISVFTLLLRQFRNWLVYILAAAALISFFAGQHVDMWVIIAVIILNALIGFIQEFRAEKAISSLQDSIRVRCKVMRNGAKTETDSENIVPGDIILLEEGDMIAADGRIIDQSNLRTIESALTGESVTVSKTNEIIHGHPVVADRKNMVYSGTFVGGGYASVVVTATGSTTEVGKISVSLGEIRREKSNFLLKTDLLGKQMSYIALFSAGLIFIVGFFLRGIAIEEILLTSIAALVAAIPEGLPAVISIVLTIGAYRMTKKKALIRKFTSAETLGAVTAILTDKTGTLTQNRLTAKRVYTPGDGEFSISGDGWLPAGNFTRGDSIIDPSHYSGLMECIRCCAISNNSSVHHDQDSDKYRLVGDPTEGALYVLARKGGVRPEKLTGSIVRDFPFDSRNKYRFTVYKDNTSTAQYVTGAPEAILSNSTKVHINGVISPIDPSVRTKIQEVTESWTSDAMRVIALACKDVDENSESTDNISGLTFTGLVAMIDPPRTDAALAVQKCHEAGIRVIMVTGDHVNTAVAISKATGILKDGYQGSITALTEQQLDELNEEEFKDVVQRVNVFARLSPSMKLRIATNLQTNGHLIAMTGDGVNDAPALKKADVGISMGIMGTDVARNASEVVLADDNFATIVDAIEEGRIVFTNSRNTSFFLITTNVAESITLLISILAGLPLPLVATQILWLNLVTDGITVMSMATEPGHGNIMQRPPQPPDEKILNKSILPLLAINSILMAGLTIGAFTLYLDENIGQARTAAFITMAFTQLFNMFNLRAIDRSVFSIGMFSNKYVNIAFLLSTFLSLVVISNSWTAEIFHFKMIPCTDMLLLVVISSIVLWTGEAYKLVRRKVKRSN